MGQLAVDGRLHLRRRSFVLAPAAGKRDEQNSTAAKGAGAVPRRAHPKSVKTGHKGSRAEEDTKNERPGARGQQTGYVGMSFCAKACSMMKKMLAPRSAKRDGGLQCGL